MIHALSTHRENKQATNWEREWVIVTSRILIQQEPDVAVRINNLTRPQRHGKDQKLDMQGRRKRGVNQLFKFYIYLYCPFPSGMEEHNLA